MQGAETRILEQKKAAGKRELSVCYWQRLLIIGTKTHHFPGDSAEAGPLTCYRKKQGSTWNESNRVKDLRQDDESL